MGIFTRSHTPSTAAVAAECAASPRAVKLTKGSGPAVARDTVAAAGGVDLAKKFDKAGVSLSKAGLDGIRAEVVLIVDHSGSMRDDYENGMVQTVVDRALGFGLQVDLDGKIQVIPFDSKVWPTVEVGLDNYRDVVNREIFRRDKMGGTYLAPALNVVLQEAKQATSPIFLVIVTDDDPSDGNAVISVLNELTQYAVFVKVLTLVEAPFWDRVDKLSVPGRVDNLNAQQVHDPAGMSDLAFADVMVEEWSIWVEAATRARVLFS